MKAFVSLIFVGIVLTIIIATIGQNISFLNFASEIADITESKPVVFSYPRTLRVIEIIFITDPSDIPNKPEALSKKLQNYLARASAFHSYENSKAVPSIKVEIVKTIKHQGKRPNPNGTWQGSLEKILKNDKICQQIQNNSIDQVWIWADPRDGKDTTPGSEYVVSSNHFNSSSGPVVADPPFCGGTKTFMIYGFDYSQTADQALHSFGHSMEGLLSAVQGSDLFWKKYAGVDYSYDIGPTNSLCGNVHLPPNSSSQYQYNSPTFTDTSCGDWNPAGSGVKKHLNCEAWKCTHPNYLIWWLSNMPNSGNKLTFQGKLLPNWWDFLVDMDTTIITYRNSNKYFLNLPFVDLNYLPKNIDSISKKTAVGETTLNWQHNSLGTKRLLLVSFSYMAKLNPTAHPTNVTFAGKPLTLVRRDQQTDRVSEIWYLAKPPLGNLLISTTLSASPQDIVATAVSLSNVSSSNPIVGNFGAGSEGGGSTPSQYILLTPSQKNQLVLGVLSTYPNGTNNLASILTGRQIWIESSAPFNQGAIQSSGAILEKGKPQGKLVWTSPQNFSWSATGVAVQLEN